MKCSYAACSRRATKKAEPWLFCADHFEAHKTEAVGVDFVERPATRSGPIHKGGLVHGTVGAYHRHRRAHETPCDDCRAANAAGERDRAERKKAAALAAHTDSATPADVCRVDGELGTACWTGGYGEVPKVQQAPKLIPLRDRHGETIAHAKVSAEDYDELMRWRWSYDYRGYAIRCIAQNGKQQTVRMHRQVLNAPSGLDVDHINRDKLDNRRENLRVATRQENLLNRGPSQRRPSSGFINIQWDPAQKRWAAFIRHAGQRHRCGSYLTVEEALEAQRAAYAALVRQAPGQVAA